MYIFATFEHSINIELAISALEKKGIPKDKIIAAPLDKRKTPRQLFDTMHRSDGYSMIDLAAVLGTVFMLLGAIYGYVLTWGPIIWGIIGALFGLISGFIIKFLILKKKSQEDVKPVTKSIISEVILLIHCEENQGNIVEQILWNHYALGLTKLNSST